MKLRFKLLLLILPLQALGMLLLGASAYEEMNQTAQKLTYQQMYSLVGQSEANISEILSSAEANIALIAQSEALSNYALADDEYMRYQLFQPSLLNLFKSYQKSYPYYFEMRYLLMDGYEDTRSTVRQVENETEEEGDTLVFKRMMHSTKDTGSFILPHADTGQYTLFVFKKIFLRQEGVDTVAVEAKQRGFLVISIELSFLSDIVNKYRLGQSGGLFFTTNDSQILYAAQGLFAETGSVLQASLFASLFNKAELQRISSIAVNDYKVHTLVRQLHPQLYMIAWLPDSEFKGNSQALAVKIGLIMLSAFLATTAILYFSMRLILIRPVLKLHRHVGYIGQGQLDLRIHLSSKDEIGALGLSLNEMSEKLKQYQKKVTYLAHYDELTGLPNRYTFSDHLKLAINEASRYQYKVGILIIDLDNFKDINDSLGHHIGDQLLCDVAQKLRACIRETDVLLKAEHIEVGRLGGDEFTLMLKHIEHNVDAALVAQRILAQLQQPFVINGHEVFQQASIGISIFPDDGLSVESLLKHADMSMYHAKGHGKNNYQFYSESMNQASQMRLHMESRLRIAIREQAFKVYYQPVIESATNRIVSAEALIRWWDEGNFMPPDQFIPIAEAVGLIGEIGDWVLKQACQQCNEWHQQGYPIKIAVNVSGKQFADNQLAVKIRSILENSGLLATNLEVELTETCLLNAHEDVIETVKQLRAMGISVALDDFGTGYSSITYLKRFPITKIKIDKSFVMDMMDSSDNQGIVNALVAISKSLKLDVTAEGVETEAHRDYLSSIYCGTLQGYFFSPAVPADKFMALLQQYNGQPS